MSDFFADRISEELGLNEEVTPEEPQKIKIGEDEYSQEELDRYVRLGKIGAEAEGRWDTKIERIYPEYTKVSQRAKEFEQENATLKAQLAQQQQSQAPQISEDVARQAREEAKKLGLLTRDDLNDYVRSVVNEVYTSAKSSDVLVSNALKLEKDIDGSDGRPRFNAETVLEYMSSTGISNPEVAYKVMYEKELDNWKMKSLSKLKGGGMSTQGAVAAKAPRQVPITRDNLGQLVSEALMEGGE